MLNNFYHLLVILYLKVEFASFFFFKLCSTIPSLWNGSNLTILCFPVISFWQFHLQLLVCHINYTCISIIIFKLSFLATFDFGPLMTFHYFPLTLFCSCSRMKVLKHHSYNHTVTCIARCTHFKLSIAVGSLEYEREIHVVILITEFTFLGGT